MPIVYNQLVAANAALPGYEVAKQLALHSSVHFGNVDGAHAGIGFGSCRAALAVNPTPDVPVAAPLLLNHGAIHPNYGIVFGNSQIAAGGLGQGVLGGPIGGHAERAALTGAAGLNLFTLNIPAAPNNAILYVQLAPCPACQVWLNGGGGGVVNPFDGVINAANGGANNVTLDVWWHWPYPAGVAAMVAFNTNDPVNQLIAIQAW